jgi:hypothetical protein
MNEQEKILLLELLMEDIRGNWNDPWERISIIRSLCDEIMTVPSALLGAIKKNADTFDGHFNDGRIFRDGQMFLPEGAVEGFGFPDEMKKGVSGNISTWFGAKPVARTGGFYGTYGELVAYVTIDRKRNDLSCEFVSGLHRQTAPIVVEASADSMKTLIIETE